MPQDNKINEIITKILEVIVPDKIILFGSRALGTARQDSDYDILIIKEGIENERKMAQDIYINLIDVNESLDIIVKTPAGIEKSKQRFMSVVKEALAHGIVVYEPPIKIAHDK